MEFSHISVMAKEVIEALDVSRGGIFVDCTAGGGGHSLEIAKRLPEGSRLICLDRDDDAIEACTKRLENYRDKFTIVKSNFMNIAAALDSLGVEKIDGVMWDLGVSSHQLDEGERGFSYSKEAPLDMRMSMQGMSAADAVNSLSQRELQDIIYRYGEDKFAPRIAAGIVRARAEKPIETTLELAEIVKSSIPAAARREGGHPARRTFQALRIYVNGELDGLDRAIGDMFDSLKVGGRLAIITFHSLEDRAVKQTFASLCEGCICPPEFPVCVCGRKSRGRLPQKAAAPSKAELEENPRSRSARLRVIEKIR